MKNKNAKRKSKRGFTLIEVLIASSIFAVIVIFAISTFSLNMKGQKQEKLSGNIIQSGQFIIENITREIRMAKEIKEITQDSFTIVSPKGENTETKKYYKNGSNLALKINNGSAQNFLPPPMELGSVKFEGVTTAAAGSSQLKQPYLEIELIIQNKNYASKPETERNRQVFRTSVVLRNFNTK